jgi:hypothetical protein
MSWFRSLLLSLLVSVPGATGARAGDRLSIVPFTVTPGDYGGGRISVPMRFGDFLGTMRLDTGASTSRVSLAPWNKDLPTLAASLSTGAAGGTSRCEDVEATNVELRATQGNNIGRARYVVSRCPAGEGDDLLGLDFFRNARFTLHFDRNEMVFFGEAPPNGRARPLRPLGPDGRLVGLDLRIGNRTVVGLLDTGAEVSAVDRRFVERHRSLFTLVKKKGAASAVGGKTFFPRIYKVKALDLGAGRVLRGAYVLSYDFGPLREAIGRNVPFIIGFNVISAYNWNLDFATPDSPTWDAEPR